MHKRALAVLAVAAFAGAVLQFGLPTVVAATGPTYTTIAIKPLPIEQPGTLAAGGTVTMCVQPLNGGAVVPGAVVFLSIDSGLFTTPTTAGGSATAQGTALTATPATFTVQATCTWANAEANGTLNDAVPVTYTAPNPALVHGRDVIAAESNNSSFDLATGQCTGPVCNTGTYVFSPVAGYQISNVPIAATGSLGAGAQAIFTVTAVDNSASPKPVPGAFLLLSLSSSRAGLGTATGVNSFSGFPKEKITNAPNRFGTDSGGSVQVTYTAASPLPSSGVDTITAQNHPTPTFTPVSTTYTYSGTGPPPATGPYTAITPFRVCDTRPVAPGIASNQCNAAGQGPLAAGATRAITIDGHGTVPSSGVTAVVVNVTAINPSRATFITLFPDLTSLPRTSNLTPAAGSVVANLVEVAVSTAGKLDVFNAAGTTNIALDVEGYVSSTSPGLFSPVAPSRICDTRGAGGGIASNQCNTSGASPIGAGGVLTFNVHTLTDNIPASGVTAVVFNLTAIVPSKSTVLTAYPSNVTRPTASNVNLNAGTTLPNRVIVQVSPTGTVSLWNSVGSVNVAVDVDGWFSASVATAQFTGLTPARLCDTRFGNGSDQGCAKAVIGPGHVLTINVAGIDGVPPTGAGQPVAVVVNVTAVLPTSATFITVYPGGSGRPNASDLNVPAGKVATNLVVADVSSLGTINLFNDLGNVNLIVDVLGYYS
jgi:nitrite reductase/ring-hydroxylating ferredoxin subunit